MLNKKILTKIFKNLLDEAKKSYDDFNSADGKIGDGDLGVTILHGLEVTRLKSKKYKKNIKSFRKTISLSDKVISVSNYTKKVAKSIIKDIKEIEVIPNFVNTKIFYPLTKKIKPNI